MAGRHDRHVAFIDFETFYDTKDGYTLGAMSLEEYLRDPRFEVMGMAVARDREAPRFVPPDELAKGVIGPLAQDDLVVAHNVAFDGSVLARLHAPFRWSGPLACTRSMAALHLPSLQSCSLGPLAEAFGLPRKGSIAHDGRRWADLDEEERAALAAYACRDVEICRELHDRLWDRTSKVERLVIEAVARMSIEPRIELRVPEERPPSPIEEAVLDDAKMAGLLRGAGAEPPVKERRDGKVVWAFSKQDAAYAALRGHGEPRVRKLVALRSQAKRERRSRKLRDGMRAAAARGLWPAEMVYAGSRTGGITGAVRTLPRQSGDRAMLCAPRGHGMLVADLSAIELRIFAWLAGESDLLAKLVAGENVYRERAVALYGSCPEGKKSKEYIIGKQSILATMYGLGVDTFLARCHTEWGLPDATPDEAKAAVTGFRDTFKGMVSMWTKAEWLLRRMCDREAGEPKPWSAFPRVLACSQRVVLPSMRSMWFEQIEQSGTRWRYKVRAHRRGAPVEDAHTHGAKVCQNLMNAMARDVTCATLYRVAIDTGVHPVFMNHDELVYVAHAGWLESVKRSLVEHLAAPFPWAEDLPLAGEVAEVESYGEVG